MPPNQLDGLLGIRAVGDEDLDASGILLGQDCRKRGAQSVRGVSGRDDDGDRGETGKTLHEYLVSPYERAPPNSKRGQL